MEACAVNGTGTERLERLAMRQRAIAFVDGKPVAGVLGIQLAHQIIPGSFG